MSEERHQDRLATCQCGQLSATCRGEPVRISVCHCLDCLKRSGSSFAAQARFAASEVTTSGNAREWSRAGDSGDAATFSFCPQCGSTVWYRTRQSPDLVAIPIGTFADPAFPPPHYSIYEERKHRWVAIAGDEVEHHG